jgi:hypothetical protein
MLIFNSTTLIWFNLVVIIGVLSSIGIMCYLIPFLLKIFIQIRYRYLSSSSVDRGTVLHKNYDSIDEQLIDGINKFKRKMPVV